MLKEQMDRAANRINARAALEKCNDGKLRWDLAPWRGFKGIVEAMMYGVKTHGGERDWEKGYAYSERFASAMRHMLQWWLRNDMDESGLSHLKHAGAQISMLIEYIERNMDHLDDRPPSADRSAEVPPEGAAGFGSFIASAKPCIPRIPRECDHLGFRYYKYTSEGARVGPICDDCRRQVEPGVA